MRERVGILLVLLVLGISGCPAVTDRAGAQSGVVDYVVDGDTLHVAGSGRVRLLGIDTPEHGECGFDRAGDALAGLVLHKAVGLVPPDPDRGTDVYGRLLRYVDVGDTDAGLTLIARGLAVARYDSRDGYGPHPREPEYIAVDAASPAGGCPAADRPTADMQTHE